MDFKKIEKLAELMKQFGLSEVEITEGADSYKLRTASANAGMLMQAAPQLPTAPPPAAAPTPSMHKAPFADAKLIRSPFVGTFYASPSPGSDPYVHLGKSIRKGDALCIIEAMKLMNEIESDTDGIIAEILVENGQTVEFDQPIFRLQ